MKKWLIHQPPEEAAKQIRSGSNLSMLCAQVLASRGMHNVQEAAAFLQCDGLADPFLTADMETAADYINQAMYSGSRICAQGLCPSLFHCVCCERQPVEGEELFFSQQNHGILDKACLGHVNDAKRISAPALYAMQYIVTASLGKLYTFTVTEEVLHELERHIHTYIAANTEKRFKSLEILEIMS